MARTEIKDDSVVGGKEQEKELASSSRNDENKEKGLGEVEVGDSKTTSPISPTASKSTTWYSGAEIIALVRGAFNERDRYEEGVVIQKLRQVLSSHQSEKETDGDTKKQ